MLPKIARDFITKLYGNCIARKLLETKKDQENPRHRFEDNYITNHLMKF